MNNTYLIDESSFLVTSLPLVTFPAAVSKSIKNKLKSIETSFASLGIKSKAEKIPPNTFADGQREFLVNGKTAHLYPIDNEKIKGYHLGEIHYGDTDGSTYLKDLIDLGLINPPADASPTDQFIFMPSIRKNSPIGSTAPAKPYLTIAVSRYINGSDSGDKYEYCLPCPDHCPTNFPLQ